MDAFIKRVEQAIASRQLLPDGAAVLVAVSGGLDSMVLLHVLHALAPRHGWTLTAAHFNHLLRGRAADADQHFVARAAESLGLRFESASADVRKLAKAQKLSIEMAARTLRHEFLARAARGLGIGYVALAHHADDQVELFLLRLLRGASSEGLAGMHWRTTSPADARITLVRPLLNIRKGEVGAWAREQKIRFREDATNASTDILRNRIRCQLLPLLRRDYQPGIDNVLLRESELLRDESDFIAAEATKAIRSRKSFDALPVALQRRVLHAELLRAGIAPDFKLIEQVRAGAGAWTAIGANTFGRRDERGRIETKSGEAAGSRGNDGVGQASSLSRKSEQPDKTGISTHPLPPPEPCVAFGRSGDRLEACPTVAPPSEPLPPSASFRLRNGELTVYLDATCSVRFGEVALSWTRRAGTTLPKSGRGREFFDAAAIGETVILRHWRPGDRFQPIGMKSRVKLQDLFTNQKIPRERRHKLVVATTPDGEVFWVEGVRIGEGFKLTPATKQRLEWKWKRRESRLQRP